MPAHLERQDVVHDLTDQQKLCPAYPYLAFDFTTDYTADGPRTFFGGYAGYLQADALAQYEGLYGEAKVKHVCCWAHARRKFVAAHDAGDERAARALELIGTLYAIERALPPLLAGSDDPVAAEQRRAREDQRRAIRVRESEGVLRELQIWMDRTRSGALPKSPLGSAIGYTTNNWAALVRYRDEGHLAIDNNLAERTLRSVAVGRNNWGVVGSEVGGRTAAVLYSVVGTCKHLSIDPWAYLRKALPGLFALGEEPSAETTARLVTRSVVTQPDPRPTRPRTQCRVNPEQIRTNSEPADLN